MRKLNIIQLLNFSFFVKLISTIHVFFNVKNINFSLKNLFRLYKILHKNFLFMSYLRFFELGFKFLHFSFSVEHINLSKFFCFMSAKKKISIINFIKY